MDVNPTYNIATIVVYTATNGVVHVEAFTVKLILAVAENLQCHLQQTEVVFGGVTLQTEHRFFVYTPYVVQRRGRAFLRACLVW